jgi:hypothetical protein
MVVSLVIGNRQIAMARKVNFEAVPAVRSTSLMTCAMT